MIFLFNSKFLCFLFVFNLNCTTKPIFVSYIYFNIKGMHNIVCASLIGSGLNLIKFQKF